jgi:ribosomal protein S8
LGVYCVPQTKLKQGILDISIKIGFIDSLNFNAQNIDNTAFVIFSTPVDFEPELSKVTLNG